MRPVIMGLDLGTTLCKCAVYSLDGKQLIVASRPVETDHSIPNGAQQQPGDWISAITGVLADAARHMDGEMDVAAIGVSAHGPGVVFVDKHGASLCPVAIWQDNRCASEGYKLFEEIGYDWVGHGMPQTGFAARLRWSLGQWPDMVGKISHIHDIKGFLLHFLTGRFVTEPSSSAGNVKWDKSMLGICGLSEEMMDEILPSTAVAGGLSKEVAEKTGLKAGTPVVCGLNDGAAAMFGAGTLTPGSGAVSVSTNGIARVVLEKKLPGKFMYEHSMFCWPYLEGKYVAGGFTKTAGDTVQWFLDMSYGDCAPKNRLNIFNEEAEKSGTGARGIVFYPWLLGRGSPSATEKPEACFMGMGRHHTRGDCARAIFEGLAFALKDMGSLFRNMGYPWNDIKLTGGGMKSPLWRSIVCDVLDINGRRAVADSLLGAAMTAGLGVGLYQDGAGAIAACVRDEERPVPRNAEATAYYQRAYAEYTAGKKALEEFRQAVERSLS